MHLLHVNSLTHDKDFDDDGNYDDKGDDDHVGSVLAHAVLLEHDQGLQGSSHEGVQVFSMSPDDDGDSIDGD